MKTRKVVRNASCWVFEIVEISRPMPSAQATKRSDAPSSSSGAAAERHVEPEQGHAGDQDEVDERDERERNRLAEDQLGRAERAHHELLERADLALAHHGERGEQLADQSMIRRPITAGTL